MVASTNPAGIEFAFDIGHSSIGWAVLADRSDAFPEILGCGSVLFEKDSALASTRRLHRQQRRHVRATRQRIARLEKLLVHIGAFASDQLAAAHRAGAGSPAPWLLAARVLASRGERTLTWPELWDVLRWYAHNRGYEQLGAARETEAEDTEKVENAKREMGAFGTTTMAETICAWLGQDPFGERIATAESYKAKNCAFERSVVSAEVGRILEAHRGRLPGLDEVFIRAVLHDARAIAVPAIRLPRRYCGGLLFGRLATRYHNRIIGRCPISDEKVPSRNCSEFLRYRWAMQLANIRVATATEPTLRELTAEERQAVHARMLAEGYLGVRELKDAVRSLPGVARDNLDQLLLHPDAKEALVLDPVRKLVTGDTRVSAIWAHLPERVKKRACGHWRRGRALALGSLREEAAALGHDLTGFDAAVDALCAAPKKRGKNPPPTREELLATPIDARRELAKLSGRAPYARPLLAQAFADVLAGRDPKGRGGCLEETDEVRRRRSARPLAEQTNNHLVRHRLQIAGRLLRDLIGDPLYGGGNATRVKRITIEVNRDLRDMAGLTAQEIAKELGSRLASHKKVSARLEKELPENVVLTAGLIRKARIADDLGWRCPYTGVEFEPVDLIERRVDKDHIVPRSHRTSDSLDSLVITFAAVNKWKGQRTAWQFVTDEGGKPVPEAPHLSIMPAARFKAFVEGLDTRGHADDYRRKQRRKEFLLLPRYEEKNGGFTPGQLTQTSQLARLAAYVVAEPFAALPAPPQIVALPGSVTATVRRGWDLLGCLSEACPAVLDKTGAIRTKTEIRNITHLHHALDACVLGLAAILIPNNQGDVWRLISERRLRPEQQARLAALGLFDFDSQGGFRLRDLPAEVKQQIRARLAERRVVQHVPADMSGLRLEENTRGIVRRENGRVFLRQRKKNADGKVVINETAEWESKVIGLPKIAATGGKLAAINGVRVIVDNFGVAILDDAGLPPEERFAIIPFANVWRTVRELAARNGGRRPEIWRNGQIIDLSKGPRAGQWRIFSIKNTANMGLVLDLGSVEAVSGSWINVRLKSLLRDGARRIAATLAGSPHSSTAA